MIFMNRIRKIEKELVKASKRERKNLEEDRINREVEDECIRFFVRGLRWELKTRNWDEARKQALITEREYSNSILCESVSGDSREMHNREIKTEIRRVNLIETEVLCTYCKVKRHGVINCFKFANEKFSKLNFNNLFRVDSDITNRRG